MGEYDVVCLFFLGLREAELGKKQGSSSCTIFENICSTYTFQLEYEAANGFVLNQCLSAFTFPET